MILLIDNYDSFVYNLARYMGELGQERRVVRNDQITLEEISALDPLAIMISPGPCTPDEAGVSLDIIKKLGPHIPIFGVCLGHQCIGQVYGAKVTRGPRPVHGRSSLIRHNGQSIFEALPNPIEAARYHSLIVTDPPEDQLTVTAHTAEGQVMAIEHVTHPVYGVQFHPESVLTYHGHKLLQNFLNIARDWKTNCDQQLDLQCVSG